MNNGNNGQLAWLLSHNQLNTLPASIGKLSGLRYLYLDNNPLTHLPPEIGSLTKLQSIDLGKNTLLSNDDVDALRRLLPDGCRVETRYIDY